MTRYGMVYDNCSCDESTYYDSRCDNSDVIERPLAVRSGGGGGCFRHNYIIYIDNIRTNVYGILVLKMLCTMAG